MCLHVPGTEWLASDLDVLAMGDCKKGLEAGAGTDSRRHSELPQMHWAQKSLTGHSISTKTCWKVTTRDWRLPSCESGLHLLY